MIDFPSRSDIENMGGIFRFHFIPVYYIAKFPNILNNYCSQHIQFVTGFSWFKGYGTIETPQVNDEAEKTDSGYIHANGLVGFFPINDVDIQDLFHKMEGNYFVLRVVDNNDRVRLIGTDKAPLIFSWKSGSGAVGEDRNGYSFSFTGTNNIPSPYYGDDNNGSFSNDFSIEFE